MKQLATAIALAVAAVAAGAQTTNYDQVVHLHTALGHLTVLELGEPIKTFAVANPDSFTVEQHGDKIFLKPVRDREATNLFIWTATRELSYELDSAGEVSQMNVLIRSLPKAPSNAAATPAQPSAQVSSVSSPAPAADPIAIMADSETIVRDEARTQTGRVNVTLQQVYRENSTTCVRYRIENRTTQNFHASAPSVSVLVPARNDISLAALRNHQLKPSMTESFKVSLNAPVPVLASTDAAKDLAPGESETGVIRFRGTDNAPQIFAIHFSDAADQPVSATAVL